MLSWCLCPDSSVLFLKWLRTRQASWTGTSRKRPGPPRGSQAGPGGWLLTPGRLHKAHCLQQLLALRRNNGCCPTSKHPGAASPEQAWLRHILHYREKSLPVTQPCRHAGEATSYSSSARSADRALASKAPGQPKRAVAWRGEAQATVSIRQVHRSTAVVTHSSTAGTPLCQS